MGGGTFIALALTRIKFSIINKNLLFFDGTQSAYEGAFINAMLQDKNAQRSNLYSDSLVGIVKNAKNFVDELDVERRAYHFARRAMEVYSKVFPIGL